jgi:hypothetical protein
MVKSKTQNPKPKEIPSPKLPTLSGSANGHPGTGRDWDLELGVCLGFGVWSLEF